jgi:hypothetical protein
MMNWWFRQTRVLALIVSVAVYPAAAQQMPSADACNGYVAATQTGLSGSVPVVPASMLTRLDVALPCLIRIIESLDGKRKLPTFDPDVRSQFLSATGALRTIISQAIAFDEAAKARVDEKKAAGGDASESDGAGQGNLRAFIEAFRKLDNTKVAQVLVHALRSDDRVMRSNALLILANVVDNTTVCVAIDHLYDSEIATTPFGVNGRANLLSVVSVVAPWAYRETYYNIEQVLKFIEPKVDSISPELKFTRDVIPNIRERLARQTNESNRAVCLPEKERDCYAYQRQHATAAQLSYPSSGCKG